MRNKAIFFDFDGTLWFGKYGETTLETLNKLHENYYLFYCSGRSEGNTQFDLLKVVPFDGYLFGGCVAKVLGKEIYRRNFTDEEVNEMLAMPRKYLERTVVECEKNSYRLEGCIGNYTLPAPVKSFEFLRDRNNDKVAKFSVIKYPNESGGYLPIDEEVIKNLEKSFFVVNLDHYIEVMMKGCGKDLVIRKTCEYLGIKRENTYCFGDSENDLGMFKEVGTGIAMSHSPEALKKLAKYVTTTDLEGITEGAEKLGLI